jgi:apolipoprotein N-acyltransferase
VLEEDRQATIERAAALAERHGAYIQISLGVFTRAPTRPYYLNQSILIDDKGKVAWTYDKTYPVIPSETIVTPFGPGRLPVAETAVGRISTAICNDFHFPALIRQAGQTRADIVMAPYNSLTPYEQQDATVAVMRAVENGYGMVRATGNGVSLIVDDQGRVLGSQPYGEGGGVMIADLPTHGVATFYSRIGDAFAYLCAAGLAGLCGLGLRRRG